jgi:RNA polymerase sigma-70 factor, ECF subfamily
MTLVSAKPTDAALMQEIQAGGRLALGELYDRFSSRAYRTAFSVCHDRDCAQDAVQDAFVAMWSSRMTYQPTRGPVVRWAMTIVRHRALYLARRQSAVAGLKDEAARIEDQPAQDDVPAEFDARTQTRRLMLLLARLPPAQREVIRLAFFDGLTHREIARRLALPPGTVKGRMRLGLSKLRSGLSDPNTPGRTNPGG